MMQPCGAYLNNVYGRGLIGEETDGRFKTYHFDYRGSTVAITDIGGNVTDTFEYDTYGKLTSRTDNSDIICLYNGKYDVVTDANGNISANYRVRQNQFSLKGIEIAWFAN